MAPNVGQRNCPRQTPALVRDIEILETIPGTSGIGQGGALLPPPADSPHEAHGDPESVAIAALASW